MGQKRNRQGQNDSKGNPLFTGDYIHDNSVTEFEKAAEASKIILNKVEKWRRQKKNEQ